MANPTYFVQACSTCGRNLQVRVEYLGKSVACQHCGSRFKASQPSTNDVFASEPGLSMLDRADELIRQSGINLARSSSIGRPGGIA